MTLRYATESHQRSNVINAYHVCSLSNVYRNSILTKQLVIYNVGSFNYCVDMYRKSVTSEADSYMTAQLLVYSYKSTYQSLQHNLTLTKLIMV